MWKALAALFSPRKLIYSIIALIVVLALVVAGYWSWKTSRLEHAEDSLSIRQDQAESLAKHLGEESKRREQEDSKREQALREAEQQEDAKDPVPESIRIPSNVLFYR